MNVSDIKDIEAEAGIIASVIKNPEFTFYSEQLKPNYFTDTQNAYIYYAVSELAKRGITKVDAYNITNILNLHESTRKQTDTITITALNEMIDVASYIARTTPEEYKLCVDKVMNAAFRRDTYNKLVSCEQLCLDSGEKSLDQKIYEVLDGVIMEFSTNNEIPQYKDVVDAYWTEIQSRQHDSASGSIEFKFPTLNAYTLIERGELVIFGAEPKKGKSILMLNFAVDLLRMDYRVLYIDSELSSRLFTNRLLSHLTGIPAQSIKLGRYGKEEEERLYNAISWVKTKALTHLYMPVFDEQSLYTAFKKVQHTQGIDVLIVDYFKDTSDKNTEAFGTYKSMGSLVDKVKNEICGKENVAGLGAVQTTATGRVADSVRIVRNASSIIMLKDKLPNEIDADGEECGNKKLVVEYNRNGAQMYEGEYIDLNFDGSRMLFTEAKQHTPLLPF